MERVKHKIFIIFQTLEDITTSFPFVGQLLSRIATLSIFMVDEKCRDAIINCFLLFRVTCPLSTLETKSNDWSMVSVLK